MNTTSPMVIEGFFDPKTSTSSYLLMRALAIENFVAMRISRDATLAMPVLILSSVQVNMRAGKMPEAEENGISCLKNQLNGN